MEFASSADIAGADKNFQILEYPSRTITKIPVHLFPTLSNTLLET
jgi:hypothetical protein